VWPTQLLLRCISGDLSLVIKWLGPETDHSPPSSAKVKNEWSYTSASPMCLHVKHRNNLTWFTFQVRITAVDIDPAMLEVATGYFDLVQDERLDVYIRDGIQFIEQAAEKGLGICQFIQ